MNKRQVNSLRDSEIAAAVAAYMYKDAKTHPVVGRLWEGSLGTALSRLFDGRLDEERATSVRSFLRLNRFSSHWENGVFKGWKVPSENPLSNWKSDPPRARTKVNPQDLVSPLPVDAVKVSCFYCGGSFDTPFEFEAHKKGKVNCMVAEAKCKFCDKEFVNKGSYTPHVRVHLKEIEALVIQVLQDKGDMTRKQIETTLDLGFHLDEVLNRLKTAGVLSYVRSVAGGGTWGLKNKVGAAPKAKATSVPANKAEVKKVASPEPMNRILENIERLALDDLKKRHVDEYEALVMSIIDKLTTAAV